MNQIKPIQTEKYDIFVSRKSLAVDPDIVDETRSLLTGVCFTLIGSVKSVIWAFKPENQPNYGVPMTVE